ncbi:hypothetical protein ACLK2D_06365 [Escherichia coli]
MATGWAGLICTLPIICFLTGIIAIIPALSRIIAQIASQQGLDYQLLTLGIC